MSSAEKVIECEAFVLKDAQGNIRAELGLRQGWPRLILFADDKNRRAELFLDANNIALQFYDDSGTCRLQACLERDRAGIASPSISIAGPKGDGGIVLYVGSEAITGLTFLGRDNKPILNLTNQLPVTGEQR
jgi:hypothetical protein